MDNIVTKSDVSEIWETGIAYVVIPVDVDRDIYIAECYKTSTISIFSEHNGFTNRVPVDKYTLNFIVFPKTRETFGSAVSFKIDPLRKRPIVDGIYFKADELCDLQENQFKFKRELDGNVVEFVGSPQGKYIGINVISDKGGEFFINVKTPDESGKISINVDGNCNITSLYDTTLKQFGDLNMLTVNREDNTELTLVKQTSTGRTTFTKNEEINTDILTINSEEQNLNTQSLSINGGDQNFVLGKLFKAFMKDLITEIGNATVTTELGEQPLLNKEQIANYASDDNLNKFLSTIGFIDK